MLIQIHNHIFILFYNKNIKELLFIFRTILILFYRIYDFIVTMHTIYIKIKNINLRNMYKLLF